MRLQTSLTLETANQIVFEVLRVGRELNLFPLTVVALDAGGKLVAMQSEDGSGVMRYDVAFGKAWGALGMGFSSRLIRDRLASRTAFQLVSLHVVYEAPMGALGIGSVATGAQGPHGLA